MKRIERLFLSGCGYTVLILTLFYLFALIVGLENTSIGVGRFFIILFFSLMISFSEMIFEIKNLRRLFRLLIHYFTLMIAFVCTFLLGDFFETKGMTAVLIAIFVYTLLYAVIFSIIAAVRKLIGKADTAIEGVEAKKQSVDKRGKNDSTYVSRFK